MIVGSDKMYQEALASLERIQQFDVTKLPRESELGNKLNFSEAIAPAQHLIDLYCRLSTTALQDFPDQTLTIVRDNANNHYKLFSQILEFDTEQQTPHDVRASIITSLENNYAPAFVALHPYISYSLHRSADFQRLDSEARATLQSIEDKSNSIATQMESHEEEAQKVLDEIRNVAAEEGVTQQATHFRTESEYHLKKADEWKDLTVKLSWALGAFAVLSLFIHKIPFLKPETTYDAVQLSISKILIFSVVSYMLFLAARNFMSHKHNAIVNKHRQNALMTHRALIEASGDAGVRDAVLIQAASCIFSPQSTGYTNSKSESDITAPKSVVEILSKSAAGSSQT